MDIAFCCFFHKQNKKWEDDKITTTGRVTPIIMTLGLRKGISEADHENDPLTGSLNNSAAADLGCIKVDDPMKGDENESGCSVSLNPENTPIAKLSLA